MQYTFCYYDIELDEDERSRIASLSANKAFDCR